MSIFKIMLAEGLNIEQIAIGSKDPIATIKEYKRLGLNEWAKDTVKASGFVFGEHAENKADLYFNYDLGYELEIICYYPGCKSWHDSIPRQPDQTTFLSHKGLHVNEVEMVAACREAMKAGIPIAQSITTLSHTNPYIKDSRRYKYVIFNTREIIGWDLKLIQRLNLDYSPYTG